MIPVSIAKSLFASLYRRMEGLPYVRSPTKFLSSFVCAIFTNFYFLAGLMLTGLASADTGHGDKNSVGREQIPILNNP
jgi:hypothetical protein